MTSDTTCRDLPPEELAEKATGPAPDFDQVLGMPDPLVEPEPSAFDLLLNRKLVEIEAETGLSVADFLHVEGPYKDVKWPCDLDSPDYAHIAKESVPSTFDLTGGVIEKLIEANAFGVFRGKDLIAFALRGAQLTSGYEAEGVDSVEIKEIRPDHRHFRCIVGFYRPSVKKLNAYAGSTVPNPLYVVRQTQNPTGRHCNLLPNGLYTHYVWRHRGIEWALRLCESNGSNAGLEEGAEATVLRTKFEEGAKGTVLRARNDNILDVHDVWDLSRPLDNVHCSYFVTYDPTNRAYFSSAGCLTVRGEHEPSPSDQWAKFQELLKLVGRTSRVDLLLMTGKDAAIASRVLSGASDLYDRALVRLRQGSRGEAVERLQAKLGVAATSFFGPCTRKALTSKQHEVNESRGLGKTADGIYSPELDQFLNWNIFSPRTA